MDTFDELRDKILEKVDIIDLVELLELTVEELLERFEDKVMLNRADIEEFLE